MQTHPHLVLTFAALTAVTPLWAHGGQYRGPSDVQPPSSASNSSRASSASGAPAAPAAPASSGPTNATAPVAASGNTSSPASKVRGAAIEDDLGRWEFWWEFGKDPYLRLRDAIYGSSRLNEDDAMLGRRFVLPRRAIERPNATDLDQVADALVGSLRQAHDRDTISGCIVALAKIGRDGATWRLHDLLVPMLKEGDQELRETSALALGIAGMLQADSIDLLLSLVRDDADARRVSGGQAVNERTRAFAAYACGLLLARCQDAGTSLRLVTGLREILLETNAHGRELKVAAIEALSQFPHRLTTAAGVTLRRSIAADLGAYYLRDEGVGERLLQAHVPPAMARLMASNDPSFAVWKERFLADLRGGLDTQSGPAESRGTNQHIAESCAMALGAMATAWNADTDVDAPVGQALLATYKGHRDQQTRAFALLSLARMGGQRARTVLLNELSVAGRAIEQPWCAVALGVLHARALEMAAVAGKNLESDSELVKALSEQLATARNPSSVGALAIALGLAGEANASDRLRAVLADNRQRDDVAGYVALALGLLRDSRAVADIRSLLEDAARRPFLMMQCVRALGLIGDQSVAETLCGELEHPDASLVRLSAVASALGQIGDRKSLQPLLRMLANDQLTPLTRAFAAVALGSICDKDPLPWNSVFASNSNYRAATETLTDGASGILDIL